MTKYTYHNKLGHKEQEHNKGKRLENLCAWKDGNSVYPLKKSCNGCNGYDDKCDSYMTTKMLNERNN